MLTTKSLLVLSMAYMSFATSEAYALEEWRVLGPAYSYHLSKDGAMFSGDEKWACQTKQLKQKKALDNTVVVTETKLGQFAQYELPTKDGAAIKTAIGPSPFVIATNMVVEENGSKRVGFYGLPVYDPITQTASSNTVSCDSTGHGSNQQWSQRNPAFGLQWSSRTDEHVDKAFGTVVTDSYGQAGFMAGIGRLWPVVSDWHGFNMDAGVVTGLWWRSELAENNTLYRTVVPFILPALSVTEEQTGLGFNIAVAPKLTVRGRTIVSTTTVMFQTTLLVQKSGQTQTSFSLQMDPSGMNAKLATFF